MIGHTTIRKKVESEILRFVRMTFDPARVSEFLAIYEESSGRILDREGCLHLELLTDVRHPNVMMTFSIWSSEEALESYRSSNLFKTTWARTRVLFAAKPEAASFRRLAGPTAGNTTAG